MEFNYEKMELEIRVTMYNKSYNEVYNCLGFSS